VRWWWLTTLLACLPCTAQIEVKDYIGRDVVLEQPARRIVALAPHIVENLYSAGAGQYLVGAVSYSDFPAAAADVPRVGSYRAFSLETILALQPDLIITWASGNGIAALQDLQTLGVPVYVSEPRKLDDIPRSLRAYARLAGTEQVGERAAQKVSQALHALAVDYSERRPISVFYQIWHEPLQTLNGEQPDLSQADGLERLALLFVAADCPICRSVLPAFEQALLDSESGSMTGYWVSDGLQMADYDAYCDEHLIDPSRFIVSQDLGLILGIRQIPALVLLDRDRKLVAVEVLNGPRQVARVFRAHPEAIPNLEKST
jgi:hypothetical protein